MSSDSGEYEPFGEEWRAQMMQMRKADLVDFVKRAQGKLAKAREACAKKVRAAERLCTIYFEIAEDCKGEDWVRKERDRRIDVALKETE